MASDEKAVAVAGRLYEARDTARRLYGERYDQKAEPWRVMVRDMAREWGCRAVEVPLRLDREGGMPSNPLLLFAAVVDCAEILPPEPAP